MTSRRDRGRKAVPAPEPLRDLEAELHARQNAAPAASGDGDAGILLAYVGAHPAATAKEVVLHGRGTLSYRRADDLLRTLLDEGRLRSDPPGVPYTGRLQLFLTSPGKD